MVLSICASLCHSLATLCIQIEPTHETTCESLKWGSLQYSLMWVGGCLNIASLNFGSLSLKAGLGVIDIAIIPATSFLLKVPNVSIGHILLSCIACGMCIFSQFPPAETPLPAVIRGQWNTVSTIVFVSVECLIACLAAVSIIFPCCANRGAGCVSSGFFSAIASLLFSTYFRLISDCSVEETVLLLFFAILCLILCLDLLKTGIRQLVGSVRDGEPLTVGAFRKTKAQGALMQKICYLTLGALHGVIVNKEADHMDAVHGLVLGAGLVLCGVSMAMYN